MSESDDEDLKQAIALSLGEPNPSDRAAQLVINVESDDEDPSTTAREAQALGVKSGIKAGAQFNGSVNANGKSAIEVGSSLGMLGMDRKRMEAERLARKRKTSISPPPARKIAKHSLSTSAIQYPQGVVKKTWAFGHPRAGDDIKLEEVLQKDDLQLAVLSSFQWDIPWLLAKIGDKTKITLVMQAKEEATRQQYQRETSDMPNLRLCFPSMEGQIHCMHSKLMLLSHPGYLRIGVPTANLVNYDWGETGEMENTMFLIDLPRLADGKRSAEEDLTFFGQELLHFLEAKGLDQSIVNSLRSFDFTATEGFAFIHTIGGSHIDEAWRRTGHCGLGTAVQKLGLATKEKMSIDFVTSSVGSLSIDFVSSIYRACGGDDGTTDCSRKTSGLTNGSKKGSNRGQESVVASFDQDFRIYFPTHETVTTSSAGGAGTICIQLSYYNHPKFPRQLMRDCKSTRPGMLMHNKILFVRPKSGKAWAYVGSANCSESAWGNRLVKDRVTKAPKLNCRNWECGVLIPVESRGVDGKQDGLDVFRGTVPMPMHFPGEEYREKKPWYFMEQ